MTAGDADDSRQVWPPAAGTLGPAAGTPRTPTVHSIREH